MSVSHLSLFHLLRPQAPDKHGLTPLISACYEGHASCVKVLLEKVGTEIYPSPAHRSTWVSFTPQCLLMYQRLYEC